MQALCFSFAFFNLDSSFRFSLSSDSCSIKWASRDSKLNEVERKDFLEIIEERHELKSTIVTSQVPVKHWHELIGDSTIADALLDRLVHNSYRIELEGESIRKQKNEGKTDKNAQVK